MKTYIGIDLGGTNIRVGKVNEIGEILQIEEAETPTADGREAIVEKMIAMVKKINNYQECEGIGMGVPGPVDAVKQIMTLSSNLPNFDYYPFTKIMEKELGLEVTIDNDANMAGLGEAVFGAGKGYPIVYYVTVSTGIGGALIINEKAHSGKNGYAGEIANIIIDPSRERYNHLNAGAIENEASGTALVRKANSFFNTNETSAKFLFEKAKNNDADAIKIVNQAAKDLAIALSTIAHVCDPHIFVLGGGVMKSKDYFLPLVKEYYHSFVHPGMRDIPIVTTQLAQAGLLGAAMLARKL